MQKELSIAIMLSSIWIPCSITLYSFLECPCTKYPKSRLRIFTKQKILSNHTEFHRWGRRTRGGLEMLFSTQNVGKTNTCSHLELLLEIWCGRGSNALAPELRALDRAGGPEGWRGGGGNFAPSPSDIGRNVSKTFLFYRPLIILIVYDLPPFRFSDTPTDLTWPGRTQCQILLMFGVSLYFHLEIFLRLFLLSFLNTHQGHLRFDVIWFLILQRFLWWMEKGSSNWILHFYSVFCACIFRTVHVIWFHQFRNLIFCEFYRPIRMTLSS